jgi:hypothetical protein
VICAFLFSCASASDSGGGGSSPRPAADTGGRPRVTDSDSAKAAIGKSVFVEGTALNAKLGPVVSTGGLVIYCFGKTEWRADEVGKPIAVSGTLEQTDEFKAQEGPDGEMTAGTGGKDWVIRDCKVETAGAPANKEPVDQGGGGW